MTGELDSNSRQREVGSIVVLVHLNGKEILTEISGIEQIKPIDYGNFSWNKIVFMLKDAAKKEDVLTGTEVF